MSTEFPTASPAPSDASNSPPSAFRVRGAATAFTDYATVLAAQTSSVLVSLVTVSMSSRILGPSGYAVVAYVALISGLVSAITASWTASAFTRYGREELETAGNIAGLTWARVVLAAPLVLLCVIIVATLKLADALPPELTWGYLALAIVSGVLLGTSLHTIYAVEVFGRMKLSALWIVLGQVVVVVGLAAVIVTGRGKSAFTVVALLAVSQLVITVALATRSWSALWPPTCDRKTLRRVLRFSTPLIAFTFGQYVIASVDLIVLQAHYSTADVGAYALAYRGYGVLQSLAIASSPVLTPLLVSLRVGRRERVVRQFVDRTVGQMSVIGSVLAGLAAPFVPFAIAIVAGHSFHASAAPMIVLLVANAAFFMAVLLGSVLLLYERTRAIAVTNLLAAAINVVGDIVLVGVFNVGIIGPAIATAATVMCLWAGSLVVAKQAVGLPPRINPIVFAPVVVGVVAPLAHAGLLLTCVGMGATLLVGLWILRVGRMFAADDVALISQLDIPQPLKRLTLKFVNALAH
jgi:O-antigen/teichoic acid export membrane protein